MRPTRWPSRASAMARLTATVVLPTPPLPEPMAMIFEMRDNAAGAAESLAIVLGLCAIAVGQLFLKGQNDAFLIFPFMLLAAFRVSAPYSALAIAAVSAITAGFTISGVGPFAASQVGPKVSILSLQLFLACVTFSNLIAQGWLTSLFQARRRATKALSAARQKAVQTPETPAVAPKARRATESWLTTPPTSSCATMPKPGLNMYPRRYGSWDLRFRSSWICPPPPLFILTTGRRSQSGATRFSAESGEKG
jgi:hypothetical protein